MREQDRNRQMFHKGHYEVIAARFREEMSKYVDGDNVPLGKHCEVAVMALVRLASNIADRFEFDNEKFDRNIFMERCTNVEA